MSKSCCTPNQSLGWLQCVISMMIEAKNDKMGLTGFGTMMPADSKFEAEPQVDMLNLELNLEPELG